MKIVTEHVYPPIPIRNFDWSAIDADTYSPCEDPECSCRSAKGNRVGRGATKQEAIDDLLEQLES